jgi:hypothetical protein
MAHGIWSTEYGQQYRAKNLEHIKTIKKEYYLKNKKEIIAKQMADPNRKEKRKLWEENNKIYMRQYAKDYRKQNKEYINFKNRTRKALKNQRIPKWADLKEIEKIYKECPEGHHVDHIVPLNGKIVSGLHVEYNLQYLTASENIAKHNLFPYGDYF